MILLMVPIVLLFGAPRYWAALKAERRNRLLAHQLRESLHLLLNGLRVGTGFMQALQYTAEESAAPLNHEWKRALQTVQMGRPWSEALDELAQRVPLSEMKWFVAAVRITQATGGSLAAVLDTLSATLQERQSLREKVAALTAQGKASGILLSALPFLILAALYAIEPALVRPMFTTVAGQSLLIAVMLLLIAGGLLIRRIVTIPVE